MLSRAGIRFLDDVASSRKLIFDSEDGKFRVVLVKPADVPINAGTVDRALAFMTHVGPINRMLGVGSDEQRQTAIAAVRDALTANIGADGNALTIGVWLVSAHA
jgi:hypothetical protein